MKNEKFLTYYDGFEETSEKCTNLDILLMEKVLLKVQRIHSYSSTKYAHFTTSIHASLILDSFVPLDIGRLFFIVTDDVLVCLQKNRAAMNHERDRTTT